MARQPKLRQKDGFWFSEAGGKPKRYGKVGMVAFEDAQRAFIADLAARPRPGNPALNPAPQNVTTIDLVTDFLAWVKEHRGRKAHDHRHGHLMRWSIHFGPKKMASAVAKEHMESFLEDLEGRHDPDYVKKHFVSVNAMYTWAARHGKVTVVRPFAAVEPVRVPHKVLSEHDLPTTEEVAKLFEFADADLDPVLIQFKGSRRRLREEWRAGEANPYRGFREMLVVYHGTGARTYELCELLVGDFQPRSRQVILAKHKTFYTMRKPRARQIALTDAAFDVLERLCHGRGRHECVFWRHNVAKPWDPGRVADRFHKVRDLAGVRDTITPYSFRHLFISQLLQAGVDVFRVAKMSGNSVDVIESTYGHLRAEDFQSAVRRLEAFRGA